MARIFEDKYAGVPAVIYPYLVREIPRLMMLRTGAQQPHINKGVLDESLLVLPDELTLRAYTNLVAPLFLQIKNRHQQNKELTEFRDWLLPMLMNDQVKVDHRLPASNRRIQVIA